MLFGNLTFSRDDWDNQDTVAIVRARGTRAFEIKEKYANKGLDLHILMIFLGTDVFLLKRLGLGNVFFTIEAYPNFR